jgi:hypothetical protein
MLILDRAAARTSLWPSAAVDCCTSMFIVFSGACPLRNTAIGTKRGLLSSAPAGAGIATSRPRRASRRQAWNWFNGCRAGVHLVRHGSAGEGFFDNPQLLYGWVLCVSATMGYKHYEIDREPLLKSLAKPNFMIKILPTRNDAYCERRSTIRWPHVAGDRATQKVFANWKSQGDHNAATGPLRALMLLAVLVQIVARQSAPAV